MTPFSTKTEFDYEKDDQLWEWVNSSGHGVMCLDYDELPQDCVDFCLEQYRRFGIPMVPEAEEVISVGARAVFYYFDIHHPYAIFHGISDVNIENTWATTTYRVFDSSLPDFKSYEPGPEHIEVFEFVPGQADEVFAEFIAKPGLDALPNSDGDMIREILFDAYCCDPATAHLSADAGYALDQLCMVEVAPGEFRLDTRRRQAYFELAAWASYLWFIGPYGRDFRLHKHDVVNTAYTEGECIMVDGMIISPQYYNKIDRPPQSCHQCGIQVWCVQATQILNHSTFVCEACLSLDMPTFGSANCGTKFCTFVACPRHKYHSMGQAGVARAYSEGGQLLAIARGQSVGRIMGERPAPLLLST